MRKLVFPALAAMALTASPLSAQMREAALPDIFESYNDCLAATAEGIDASALATRGWVRATIDGEPSNDPMIFGHGERAPLVLLMGEDREGICAVTARLSSDEDFATIVASWEGADFTSGEASFFANGHPVQIARTGSHDEPSIRLVVGVPPES